MPKRLILCSCAGSQQLDPREIETATGLPCGALHHELCGAEIGRAAEALRDSDGDVIIACGQEQTRFEELAAEIGTPAPLCVDLRDRAGWSDEAGRATPKIAALLAEAQLPRAATPSLDVESAGQCLLIGIGDIAFAAAAQLCDALAVTVLQTDGTAPPLDRRYEVIRGRVRNLSGALGGFDIRLDGLQQLRPSGRGAPGFSDPRDGAHTICDLVVDLSGTPAPIPAPEKREGYFRADPGNALAVAQVLTEAVQAVGTFEKPLYVALESSLCAHSRAGQTGCSRCLDACPTGAISPGPEHIALDPMICAGCGACSALCPSGAISYDAPPVAETFARIETLARKFHEAGGQAPRLLIHDDHGAEMITLAARHFSGLPADVLPLHLPQLQLFGHAEMLAALAVGLAQVELLLSPKADRETLARETALAEAMGAAGHITLHDLNDPEALADALRGARPAPPDVTPILPLGGRRQVARLAAKTLVDDVIPLPEGAPYGALQIDTDACTLCLSCVSLCPSGALLDNPDKPQLRFREEACLQCGICRSACPETAITLVPRFTPGDEALAQIVLNEEEPYCCIECGAPFGVKSTVEKVFDMLAGKHPMFAEGPAGRMIRMCDNCRVNAQYHADRAPMQAGERPRPVTTDDYFSKRRDH